MSWLVVYAIVVLAGALGVVVNVNRLRFERRLAQEMRALLAVPASPVAPLPMNLPPPVERYRVLAVGAHPPVRKIRLRHGGTFRTSETRAPLPIDGRQLFTADPPGFVWTGRVRMKPGVWIDARDMAIAGTGSMRVLLDDTISIADARGPEIDQGSALRLLAEMVWFPTALFDSRTVTWSAIDATHARATLRSGGHDVTGVFEFGADGLPLGMTAERYMDDSGLHPWGGVYRDWRTVAGLRIPFEADVSWHLAAGTFTYARWHIESITYDEERT